MELFELTGLTQSLDVIFGGVENLSLTKGHAERNLRATIKVVCLNI